MNQIKAIIFDLDGVLVEKTAKYHEDALNDALRYIDEKYVITEEENNSIYNNLSTKNKLKLLTELKGLPIEYYKFIDEMKQDIVLEKLNNIPYNLYIDMMINILKKFKYKIGLASNSRRINVEIILKRLQIYQKFDAILTNDDVKCGKPDPEIFNKCICKLGCFPYEAIILDDALVGWVAAEKSGAYLIKVRSERDVSLGNILKFIFTDVYQLSYRGWFL